MDSHWREALDSEKDGEPPSFLAGGGVLMRAKDCSGEATREHRHGHAPAAVRLDPGLRTIGKPFTYQELGTRICAILDRD